VKVAPSHVKKTERGSRGIVLPILTFGTRITCTWNKNSVGKIEDKFLALCSVFSPSLEPVALSRQDFVESYSEIVGFLEVFFTATEFCKARSVYCTLAKLREAHGKLYHKSLYSRYCRRDFLPFLCSFVTCCSFFCLVSTRMSTFLFVPTSSLCLSRRLSRIET
jgi:hypothetical protein